MPMTFVLDHENRLVRSKGWGVVSAADMSDVKGRLLATQFDPTYREFCDFSGVTDFQLTGKEVQTFATTSPFSKTARRAVIVSSDVVYGMVRMYGLMGDRDSNYHRVFRDAASALRWLGVSEDAPSAEN